MADRVNTLVTALIAGVIILAGLLGWFRPLDSALWDWRTLLDDRPPTGEVVVVEIDARSLDRVGVWPWPRRVHAELIDRLIELGASDIIFDVDFSTASNPESDAALEAALERAGGYVQLAALQQLTGEGEPAFNLPLERFRRHASPVVVNVGIDESGVVRTYPHGLVLGGVAYPSIATALTGQDGAPGTSFHIDYSIDDRRLPTVSVADILDGSVDPAALVDRQVIVGASALELRDIFIVPGGPISGAALQALGTETLKQGRALQPLGPLLPAALVVIAAGLAIILRHRMTPRAGVVLTIASLSGFEVVAFYLQAGMAYLLDTSMVHLAAWALNINSLVLETARRKFLHTKVAHERDAMSSILDQVIADNFDGVVVIDARGIVRAASRLAEEVLGAGLKGRTAAGVLPRQIVRGIARVLAETGEPRPPAPAELLLPGTDPTPRIIEYTLTRSEVTALDHSGSSTGRIVCLTFRDVTDRRHNEQRLNYLVSHDPMTGAWSRLKFVEMIDALMADDRTRERGATVILVDLGRFKAVNETLGHSYGDMVLKQVVSRLKACDVEAVARLGGDTFALGRPGTPDRDELIAFCKTLIDRLTMPYALTGGRQAIVAACAGATTSSASGYDPEVLLSHADLALSAAKASPGSNCRVFLPEMDSRLKEKQDMEEALRLAVDQQQMSLTYQPQVDLESGALVGVEALVRWRHPLLGIVPPSRFIPSAEESGQIVELGRWVLETACRDAVAWPGDIRLAVNVSPIQFELDNVVALVRDVLNRTGFPPDRLDLEITEGLFMSHSESVAAALDGLRRLGIGIALDDFGTGYSSLSYLGRLPVDKIKIDQSFVRSLPGNEESGAIIRAVMTLSETLRKDVIAEGIENADQAWMLRILGCRIGQGYHFGRPMSAGELADLLRRGGQEAVAGAG